MSFGLFARQCFISWHSILAVLPVTACQLRPLKVRRFRSSPGLFPPQRETLGRNPARTTSLLRRSAPTGLWSGSRGVENLVKSESGANLPQATASSPLAAPGCCLGAPIPLPEAKPQGCSKALAPRPHTAPRRGPGARGCAGQVSVPGSSRCQLKGALSGCLSLAHELGQCQAHTCVSSTANTLGTLNRSLQSYCCNTLGFHCLTEELELSYSAGSSVKVSN